MVSPGTAGEPLPGLLQAVAARYGIDDEIRARRLTGGYANDVFRLDWGAAPVVLHVKHPPANAASIDWEHQLLTHLVRQLPEALPPLPALDGATWFWHQDRAIWLVAWVPGEPARPSDRQVVAAVLGRLHSASTDQQARPSHRRLLHQPLPAPAPTEYPAVFQTWLPIIARARTELTRLVRSLEQRKPMTGLTHNDIFPGNVLTDSGRVTAVLDWEEATIDWLVWDVASSVWPFCSADQRLDRAAVHQFLAEYRRAGGPLPPSEDDLVVPLIRAKRILEVLRAPTDRNPNWNLQLTNLRAYISLGQETPGSAPS